MNARGRGITPLRRYYSLTSSILFTDIHDVRAGC